MVIVPQAGMLASAALSPLSDAACCSNAVSRKPRRDRPSEEARPHLTKAIRIARRALSEGGAKPGCCIVQGESAECHGPSQVLRGGARQMQSKT